MTPQRMLAQFLDENPWCKTHLEPIPNEYGMPLSPDAQFHFFKWVENAGPIAGQLLGFDPATECERLLERFGPAIKIGHVGSWEREACAR
jgi:hypothetical protein